jgi:hypothetical protein
MRDINKNKICYQRLLIKYSLIYILLLNCLPGFATIQQDVEAEYKGCLNSSKKEFPGLTLELRTIYCNKNGILEAYRKCPNLKSLYKKINEYPIGSELYKYYKAEIFKCYGISITIPPNHYFNRNFQSAVITHQGVIKSFFSALGKCWKGVGEIIQSLISVLLLLGIMFIAWKFMASIVKWLWGTKVVLTFLVTATITTVFYWYVLEHKDKIIRSQHEDYYKEKDELNKKLNECHADLSQCQVQKTKYIYLSH